MKSPAAFVLASGILVASLGAQQTWIVDPAGGPGVHFTDLPPAVAAASAGDTLLVAESLYNPYTATTIDKGITILGAGAFAVVEQITIENLPAGQTLVVDYLSATYGMNMTGNPLHLKNCQGTVVLQNVQHAVGIGSVHVRIEDCDNVVMRRCLIAGVVSPNRFLDSHIVADACEFSSAILNSGGRALDLVRCEMTMTDCYVYAQASLFGSVVAVHLQQSELTTVGTVFDVIAFMQPPFPITTTCGSLSSTVVQPTSQAAAPALIGGCGVQVFTDTPSLSVTDLEQQLASDVRLFGEAGDTAFLFVGLPGSPIVTPLGEAWLSAAWFEFVSATTIGSGGVELVTLPVVPAVVPVGATFAWQTATLTASQGVVLSPPSFTTVR